MKRSILLLLTLSAIAGLRAQTIVLKNGYTGQADGLTRNGDMLMTIVKTPTGGTGQVGYNVSDVAKLIFPSPPVLTETDELAARGMYAEALAKITPVVDFQKTIQDIPGNYWAKAALLKSSALISLKRDSEAQALLNEIVSSSHDADILTAAKLQLALVTKIPDPKQAIATYDAIISGSSDPQTLTRAWIAEGDVHMSEHEFADALLDYLSVSVFFPDHNPLAPKALWGAGQSYAKLKDDPNAEQTYEELISSYPDSPEASLAKIELAKKDKKT
jgi:tetratricopeptide (TPR) repeat protein